MNVNTNRLYETQGEGHRHLVGECLADSLGDHQAIMTRSGETLTGVVALIPEVDAEGYPGSLQVWSQSAEGDWVYVTPEGVVLRSPNPMGE